VTIYELHVATGELWNAGTVANVYISIYGEKGDTGSRQLLTSNSAFNFLRGQVSNKNYFCDSKKSFFVLLLCWVEIHCGIYKGSYIVSNISYLNSPPATASFME
jgi:hypothetical protein